MTAARPSPKRPLVLVTNDDGIFARGLTALVRAVGRWGDVWVVAPDREKSAVSLAITLYRPLRVHAVRRRAFAVDGTPADCVYLAVQKLLPRRPDVLLSGINPGPNLGRQDVSYSGTVAAAFQGAFLGIPSVAVSALPDARGRIAFPLVADIASEIANRLVVDGFPGGLAVNINVPPPPVKGLRVTALGEKHYEPEIVEKRDPRLRAYFWIGTGTPRAVGGRGTDIRAIAEGYVSLSPLRIDPTDRRALRAGSLKGLGSLACLAGKTGR
jgi:5'-nucleotidase